MSGACHAALPWSLYPVCLSVVKPKRGISLIRTVGILWNGLMFTLFMLIPRETNIQRNVTPFKAPPFKAPPSTRCSVWGCKVTGKVQICKAAKSSLSQFTILALHLIQNLVRCPRFIFWYNQLKHKARKQETHFRTRMQMLTHHMSRDLLHLGRGSSGSWVELVDEETRESVLSHELHRLLKILVRLSREAADDVSGDSYAWNPARNRTTENHYKNATQDNIERNKELRCGIL